MRATSSNAKRLTISSQDASAVAIVAAAVTMAASFALIPAFSPSNDDAYIEQSLAGTGGVSAEPTAYTTTINYALGLFISTLNSIFPSVRWWILLQLVLIFISLCLLGLTASIILDSKGCLSRWARPKKALYKIAALVILETGTVAMILPRLQFTTTAALLVSSAIFSVCSWRSENGCVRGNMLTCFILPVILATTCVMYRTQVGCLGIMFWGIATAGRASSTPREGFAERLNEGPAFWSPLALSALLALALLGINTLSSHMAGQPETNSYAGFSTLVDYPHPTFEEDPELYESVGWDKELTQLVESWFMLDERINADSLSQINQQNESYVLSLFLDDPADYIECRLRDIAQPVSLAYFVVFASLAILSITLSAGSHNRLFTWLAILVPLALLGYLALKGRLIERAVLSVLLPGTACLATLLIESKDDIACDAGTIMKRLVVFLSTLFIMIPIGVVATSNLSRALCCIPAGIAAVMLAQALLKWSRADNKASFWSARVLSAAFALLSVLVASAPLVASIRMYGWGSSSYYQNAERLENTEAMFDYFSEHDDVLYIYSGVPMTLQYLWLNVWPSNQTGWGGWRYNYTWFDDAMRVEGLAGRPTSDDLLDESVRFVSASSERCELLLRYMKEKYGSSVEMQLVDDITEDISVYRFTQGVN